jgi:hypothetical protein
VLTKEKLDEVGSRLQHAPQKSLTRLAQETGVSKLSSATNMKLLKLRTYQVTIVHTLEHVPVNRIEGKVYRMKPHTEEEIMENT